MYAFTRSRAHLENLFTITMATLVVVAAHAAPTLPAHDASGDSAATLPCGGFPVRFTARQGTDVDCRVGGPLVVRGHGTDERCGVTLLPPEGAKRWDFSCFGEILVTVSNMTDIAERIRVCVIPEGLSFDAAPKSAWHQSRTPPHSTRTLAVLVCGPTYVTDEPVELSGMQGKVGSVSELKDFSKVASIEVFLEHGGNPHAAEFAVLGVSAAYEARKPKVISAAAFFPFVDCYGQFIHDEWPGKIHSDEELAEARKREETWLAANSNGPAPDTDKYGGWSGGPQLEATGFFRTQKVDGKWWFVDPEGHLFFSIGVCSVYPGLPTKVAGREKYFDGREDAPDFWPVRDNLKRKYGDEFQTRYAESVNARFRAWGVNTIGMWHHGHVDMGRVPYCTCLDYSSRTVLPGWKGGHGRAVPDVFSGKFVADMEAQLAKIADKAKDDPWCLGAFVDNELGWDGCGTNVAAVAEKYYSTVREVLKKHLPNHLYLGSRIHDDCPLEVQEIVRLAAARHCDVVSNNFYGREPAYDLPEGAPDKPMLIGEFHFGAADRGCFSGGLEPVSCAEERASCFNHYANACIDNPRYIGCHWFQYHDQPLSGRFDGENFQCGLVSVCDVPYPEMVRALRETAASMYRRRFAAPVREH